MPVFRAFSLNALRQGNPPGAAGRATPLYTRGARGAVLLAEWQKKSTLFARLLISGGAWALCSDFCENVGKRVGSLV